MKEKKNENECLIYESLNKISHCNYMMSIQWKLVVFTAVFVLNQFVKSQSNLVSPSILEDDIHYVFKWPGHLFNLEDVLVVILMN